MLCKTMKFILNHPINQGQKIAALIRYLRWQVGSRTLNAPIIYDWVNGSRFIVKTGNKGLTSNIYTGLQEFPDMGFLLHVLRPDDLFVDIGANAGSYTILAGTCGARGVAFEPVPNTYKYLWENIRLNNLDDKVRAINKAVGECQGNVMFTRDFDTTNHQLAADEICDQVVCVEVVTLDDFLSKESPSFIKLDVEGYELPALLGATAILKKSSLHSLIIETNGSGQRYGYSDLEILDLMFDNGFRSYLYDPIGRRLLDLGRKINSTGNTLFVRDESLIRERIECAPKVLVNGCWF